MKQYIQIELNQNGLSGDELKHLGKYADLHTIKFSGNNVTEYSQLEALVSNYHVNDDVQKSLELYNLDFSESPITQKPDYRAKLFELFPNLEV